MVGGHFIVDGWDTLRVVEGEFERPDGSKGKFKSFVIQNGPLTVELRTNPESWERIVDTVNERKVFVPTLVVPK